MGNFSVKPAAFRTNGRRLPMAVAAAATFTAPASILPAFTRFRYLRRFEARRWEYAFELVRLKFGENARVAACTSSGTKLSSGVEPARDLYLSLSGPGHE